MRWSLKRQLVHKRACETATLYYYRRGHVPQLLVEIANATATDEAFLKYSSTQPRVPAGNPDGGQWISGGGPSSEEDYPSSNITSMEDAQQVIESANGRYIGRNSECASLTHALVQDLPPASEWRPGDKVQGNTDIPLGVPIATFNFQNLNGTNGYGPPNARGGVSGESHTGIYLGQNSTGLYILHQYSRIGHPVIDLLSWDKWSGRRSEAGSRYYTIDY